MRDLHALRERIGVVVEREGNERQAEKALASQLDGARRAVQRALERHGDAALGLFRRVARVLRDDGDLRVGHVRERFDRRVEVRVHAERRHQQDGDDRRETPVNAGLDQLVEHR